VRGCIAYEQGADVSYLPFTRKVTIKCGGVTIKCGGDIRRGLTENVWQIVVVFIAAL